MASDIEVPFGIKTAVVDRDFTRDKPMNVRWDPRRPHVLYFDDGSELHGPKVRMEGVGVDRRAVVYFTSTGGFSDLYLESLACANRGKLGDGVRH